MVLLKLRRKKHNHNSNFTYNGRHCPYFDRVAVMDQEIVLVDSPRNVLPKRILEKSADVADYRVV